MKAELKCAYRTRGLSAAHLRWRFLPETPGIRDPSPGEAVPLHPEAAGFAGRYGRRAPPRRVRVGQGWSGPEDGVNSRRNNPPRRHARSRRGGGSWARSWSQAATQGHVRTTSAARFTKRRGTHGRCARTARAGRGRPAGRNRSVDAAGPQHVGRVTGEGPYGDRAPPFQGITDDTEVGQHRGRPGPRRPSAWDCTIACRNWPHEWLRARSTD